MLSAVIVTHANLAQALLEAAARVAGGEVSNLETLSNDGLGPEELTARVGAAVARASGDGCIVFVDLIGSSCATACAPLLHGSPCLRILSGVNLPMVVDFVLRRADLDLDAMVQRLLQRGQGSIQELRSQKSQEG